MTSVEKVKDLCKERKVPIYVLERECGFANGYIGQLKKGVLPDDRAKKIAEYFDVSVSYLIGADEKAERLTVLRDCDRALLEVTRDMRPEDVDKMAEFIRGMKGQKYDY